MQEKYYNPREMTHLQLRKPVMTFPAQTKFYTSFINQLMKNPWFIIFGKRPNIYPTTAIPRQ